MHMIDMRLLATPRSTYMTAMRQWCFPKPEAISLAGWSMPLMSFCVIVKHFSLSNSMLHAAFPDAVGGPADITHKLVITRVQKGARKP